MREAGSMIENTVMASIHGSMEVNIGDISFKTSKKEMENYNKQMVPSSEAFGKATTSKKQNQILTMKIASYSYQWLIMSSQECRQAMNNAKAEAIFPEQSFKCSRSLVRNFLNTLFICSLRFQWYPRSKAPFIRLIPSTSDLVI
jgi:hypothetical protein